MYVFPIVSLWELTTPEVGPFLTPGAWLAGIIKKTTRHCYIQHMKALGLVVSEEKIFLCFSHDAPGAGPVHMDHTWLQNSMFSLFSIEKPM